MADEHTTLSDEEILTIGTSSRMEAEGDADLDDEESDADDSDSDDSDSDDSDSDDS